VNRDWRSLNDKYYIRLLIPIQILKIKLTARVTIRIATRKLNQFRRSRLSAAAIRNLDLSTLGVELLYITMSVLCPSSDHLKETTYSRERVQSNSLKTNQVLAAGDWRGNGSRPTTIISDHFSRAPGSVSDSTRQKTRFIYLELQKFRSTYQDQFEYITHSSDCALAASQVVPGHCAR